MVKTMLSALTAIFGLLLFSIIGLILWSHLPPTTLGLSIEGFLQPCPNKPNCICSEKQSIFDPISFESEHTVAWKRFKHAIEISGGTIQKQTDTYLWATFSTPILHFVDDVEARLDEKNNTIHLRSASRVGHSDLGRNKTRTITIKAKFAQSLIQSN